MKQIYYYLFALLLSGCVQYDKFNITEKPFVDKTSVELYIGQGAGEHSQMQLQSSPADKQFVWTSLDPSVATVSQTGLITAVSEGFAEITVASANDRTRINVWVRKWVPLEDFTLDKVTVSVKRLGKIQVMSSPVPQNASVMAVEWSSSNPAVAAVYEHGWITGNEIGTAVITAVAAGKTRQIEVEVVQELVKYPRAKWTFPGYTTASNNPQIGYSSHQSSYPIMNLLDGSATTFWHAAYSGAYVSNYPHWFIIDMHRTSTVVEIMLQRRQNFVSVNGFYFYTCPDVAVNENDPVDGYPWVYQGEYEFDSSINDEQRYIIPNAPNARYLKMYFDTNHKTPGAPNNYAQLAEFAVYGY
ncbi:MAG: Ig-like domain-containing protein [Tannerella sp.]|jgi:hypothetical protein|nr:Ig-like domain-containing protein [Tannerella sp.]